MGEPILIDTLFNSDVEFALRILVLLGEYGKPMTIDEILLVDFICSYPADFGIQGSNMMGENSFLVGELPLRRQKVVDALGFLLFKGLVEIYSEGGKGFLYLLTADGVKFDLDYDNDYIEKYRVNIDALLMTYPNASEIALMNLVEHHRTMEEE